MSLAPAISLAPAAHHHQHAYRRGSEPAAALCPHLAQTGHCPQVLVCSFYHPTPPTPTTASTVDLDPFNPTLDDPISPIYPSKRSQNPQQHARRAGGGRWPSSPLSYAGFGADGAGFLHPQQQMQPQLAGYDQWREQVDGGGFDVRVVDDNNGGGYGRKYGSSYRTVPCKNYLAGYCPRGDRCTFKHDDPPPTSPSHVVLDFSNLSLAGVAGEGGGVAAPSSRKYKTQPCKFHKPPLQPCLRGAACSYIHADDPPALAPAAREVVGKQGVRIQINGLSAAGVAGAGEVVPPGGRKGGQGGRGRKPSEHPLYKTRQCKYWQPDGSGTCTKGASCAFLHGPPSPSSSSSSSPSSPSAHRHPLFRTTPCLYFNQNTCTRGEACNFAHVLAPERMPSERALAEGEVARAPLGRKACVYQLRDGECRFGESCRYRHKLLPVDYAAFAAAERQALLQTAKAGDELATATAAAAAAASLPSSSAGGGGAAHAQDDDDEEEDDDDEGEVEIVLVPSPLAGSPPRAHRHPPGAAAAAAGEGLGAPQTPRGKRRTRSLGEVRSPGV